MQFPFCPNPDCHYHRHAPPGKRWYRPFGSYSTKRNGRLPRYRCRACGRTFSRQTFSIDYYTKKQLCYPTLLRLLSSGVSLRGLSRLFGETTNCIANRIDRLARQCIASHLHLLGEISLQEPLVADGFETFTVSQYYPENIHLLVGKDSQYLYSFNHVTISRKGRMRAEQKKRRELLYRQYRPPRGGVRKLFGALLEELVRVWVRGPLAPLTLITDEKKEYRYALRDKGVFVHLTAAGLLVHRRISSKKARTTQNALFSVNYFDREIRKDCAAHHRESLCFARNVSASMNRMILYVFYHNYLKPYRIVPEEMPVHAEVAGVGKESIAAELGRVFSRRVFLSRERVYGFWRKLWEKELVTPLKRGPEYLPAFALA